MSIDTDLVDDISRRMDTIKAIADLMAVAGTSPNDMEHDTLENAARAIADEVNYTQKAIEAAHRAGGEV